VILGEWIGKAQSLGASQVSDWAKPISLTASRHSADFKGVGFVSHAPIARPIPSTKPAAAAKPVSKSTIGEEIIEVPAEEIGLAELAELARKAAEREP
jgi:hypothetical protein